MKNDIDLTADEARHNVEAHEKQHGREMKIPPGQEKKNDPPSQADLDEDPEWFKQGQKLEDRPEE